MASQQPYQIYANHPLTPGSSDIMVFQPNDGGTTPVGAAPFASMPVSTAQAAADAAVAATAAAATALKQNILVPGTNAPKLWVVYASQSGTSAPTIGTTVKNDFSGTITFAYSSTGSFNINNSSAEFTAGKTTVKFALGLNQAGSMGHANQSTTQISIGSRNAGGTLANDLMATTLIEITVYP